MLGIPWFNRSSDVVLKKGSMDWVWIYFYWYWFDCVMAWASGCHGSASARKHRVSCQLEQQPRHTCHYLIELPRLSWNLTSLSFFSVPSLLLSIFDFFFCCYFLAVIFLSILQFHHPHFITEPIDRWKLKISGNKRAVDLSIGNRSEGQFHFRRRWIPRSPKIS